MILFRVVGDVEAAALELERRRGLQFVDVTCAHRTLVFQRIRKLLDLLEPVTADVTLVFVERH